MSLSAGFWSCPWHDPSSCKKLWLGWLLRLAHHRSCLCHLLHRRIPRKTRSPEELLESRDHGEFFQESWTKKATNSKLILFRGFGALDLFLEPEQESLLFFFSSSTQSGKSGNETRNPFLTCLLFSLFSKFANQYILENLNLCYGNS